MERSKKFSMTMYQQTTPAVDKVMAFFAERFNVKLLKNPNIYGEDLIAGNWKVEVEQKLGWIDEFPWPTLHIPYRKSKFRDCVFAVLNRDMTKMILCAIPPNTPIIEKDTSCSIREKFYEVPLNTVSWYDLT